MGYRSISTYHFRNLKDQQVSLEKPRVYLVGENGQGKSNFLEAVYFLSYGSSFRGVGDSNTVTHGEKEMSLNAEYRRSEEEGIPGSISLRLVGKEKKILLNEKPLADRKDLIDTMPAIVFTHEDMSIVTGSPERRRWFFNQTMSLYEPAFIDLLRSYRKILKMRNTALKNGRTELLETYDLQLVEAGIALQNRRAAVVEEFSRLFTDLFAEVSGLDDFLTVDYRPSWKIDSEEDNETARREEALSILGEKRHQDLDFATTTSGPHRDRFLFRYRGGDFTKIASTGQLRLMSLLLRVGQSRYFTEKTERLPVLLLDDVLLELDRTRRERFLAHLPEYEQAFFTFLPEEQYTGLAEKDTRFFYVEDGWIREK